MQITKQTSSKLIVITITTAAITAAVTTISISAATPAFAKENCTQTEDTFTCVGGSSFKAEGSDQRGGHGSRTVIDQEGTFDTGGESLIDGTFVGGSGFHQTCDIVSGCSELRGGVGAHEKGPGGNSDR